MSDAGEQLAQVAGTTEAIDRASHLVRTACGSLTEAIDRLTALLPDCEGPDAAGAVAGYRTARETLLAQLDTLDRAKKAVGA